MAYTKPKLRERLKNNIMAGSKGGKPGQWSARKAQLLTQEYKKAGGDLLEVRLKPRNPFLSGPRKSGALSLANPPPKARKLRANAIYPRKPGKN